MQGLTHQDLTVFFIAVGLLLMCARVCGEIAQRVGQPAVLGELIAGILLGPTILGALLPDLPQTLFPSEGPVAVALNGVTTLAIVLFLLVAGMEVDLSLMWRQGRTAITVSLAGVILPFTLGFLAGIVRPAGFGMSLGSDRITFALFLATAFSISALPVIARTLLDLKLYRSDLGMIVIAAAVLNDLFGWIVFAIVLGMMGENDGATFSVGGTIVMTLGFALVVLTLGRWGVHRALPWIQAHTNWPGGVIGFALTLALFGAAFTQWIGVHAVFGAFLVGVAVGDSPHLRERTRAIISQFISLIFAPLFFASVGVTLDFVRNFDLTLCVSVFLLACIGKVIGCTLGARWSGMSPREAWAVGFGMNARGAMEIILGLLALRNGLINERMFVALVVMAVGTSLISGPVMRVLLRLKRPLRLSSLLNSKAFVQRLAATSPAGVIRELSAAIAGAHGLTRETVEKAVLTRESLMPTGIGNRLAVPHARMDGLKGPIIALGLSESGVDFDAPDGYSAQLIFLILAPREDDGAQVKVLAEIARAFSRPATADDVLKVNSFTELLALLKTEQPQAET